MILRLENGGGVGFDKTQMLYCNEIDKSKVTFDEVYNDNSIDVRDYNVPDDMEFWVYRHYTAFNAEEELSLTHYVNGKSNVLYDEDVISNTLISLVTCG